MKKNLSIYWVLFKTTFLISAFTFGGGYVIVPLMKKKFVQDLKWIDEREMLDLIAIAQSSPGVIAVNTSMLIGYRMAGFLGAMATILGTVLPPLIIISVISVFYGFIKDNAIIGALLKGMQAGVAAVIIDVVLNMGRTVVKEKNILSIFIMTAAFIAVYFLKVNVFFIIIACGLIGLLSFFVKNYKKEDKKI